MTTYTTRPLKHLLFCLLVFSALAQSGEDDIFSSGDWAKKPDYFGTSLAYGLDTFAGPLEFATAYSPQFGKVIYHVSLGWRF